MFSETRIFTKPYNRISYPNMEWTENVRIQCKTKLEFGLGESIIWDKNHSIPLTKILFLYDRINQSPRDNQSNYHESINYKEHLINFHWNRIKNNEIELRIGVSYFKNNEKLKLKKNIGKYLNPMKYKMAVFTQHIGNTPKTVTNKYGELMFNSHHNPKFESKFKIGDYVKTVIGNGVKTEREGFIITKYFHQNEKSYKYKLWIDEKIYKTDYGEKQIELKK